jgi:hypothetical protein
MNKRRFLEWGKTALIVLLAFSAIRLTDRTGLFHNLSAGTAAVPVAGEETAAPVSRSRLAAQPLTVVITSAENAHYGVKYNSDALSEIYGWLTASLGEALGSAGTPESVSAEEWERALGGMGVYFDYLYVQPVSSLSHRLGVEIAPDLGQHAARRFCLAVEEESVALYYIREKDGMAYRCATALNSDRLTERLAGYVPGGARFAFETEVDAVDPYYCILDEIAPVSIVAASNPIQGTDGGAVLAAFGMNRLVANHYAEAAGTQVYVEGESSLRLAAAGRVIFVSLRDTAEGERGEAVLISDAYDLLMRLPGMENQNLQMSGISYDAAGGTYTVRFDYVVDGIVVCFPDRECAAELPYDVGGALRRGDVLCRSYAVSGTGLPMPEAQALAVVEALGGGEPMLCYADSGGSADPTWVVRKGR